MSFSTSDREQLEARGWTEASVSHQLAVLRGEKPTAKLVRPCTFGDGVQRLDESHDTERFQRCDAASQAGRIGYFVPASGAATRMFQSAVLAHQGGYTTLAELKAASDPAMAPAVKALSGLKEMALWTLLQETAPELSFSVDDGRIDDVFEVLLNTLQLAGRPKGLIPFHRYSHGVRTPVAEHIEDALGLAGDHAVDITMHFTVGQGHEAAFEAAVAAHLRQDGQRIAFEWSNQDPHTDCIALNDAGEMFRASDGRLLFRPGGHGSLLHNLAALGGDVVLIKNIDSVVPDRFRTDVLLWRRRMVGLALELEERAHFWLRQLEAGQDWQECAAWVRSQFGRSVASAEALASVLNRPIRVCGMVANEGQPGGGPFWIEGRNGITPQIVEGAQLQADDPEQVAIWNQSTHFNPVDMVCLLRDRSGLPFALGEYVDPTAWIVTEKRHQGVPLRALENPGLWNGSMADWNTVFVDIPSSTFNPVKTWADLLDERHQTAS